MKKIILILLIAIFLSSSYSFAKDAEFHSPQTEAEKVLDKILQLNNSKDHDVYSFVYYPSRRDRPKNKILKPLFTQDFLDRSAKEELELMKESCEYINMPFDGKPCDMYRGSDPILCAQDTLGVFIYETIEETDNEAIIQYAWPTGSTPLSGPRYQLVKENDKWKLNNTCFNKEYNTKFHPPQTDAEKVLARIIYINNHDKDIVSFIWKYPERDMSKDKKFENLFTKKLQEAWARGYRESPLGDDGIHHQIDFGFLMCGNGDSPDEHVYATVKINKEDHYIATAWPEEYKSDPLSVKYPFIMKMDKGVWKLDGVSCGKGHNFNTDFNYSR